MAPVCSILPQVSYAIRCTLDGCEHGFGGIHRGMTTATRESGTAPTDGIASLAERFDADVMHLPGGRARVRLVVTGGRSWDAVIAGRRLHLHDANESREADCVLTADPATWRRIATDMRGGTDA